MKIRNSSTKRKVIDPSENRTLENVGRNESNNVLARDLENVTRKKTSSDVQQYIRRRIEIIHDFQQHSVNGNADNEEQPLKLEDFLAFEVNTLRLLMEDN